MSQITSSPAKTYLRSLEASWKEGIFAAVMVSITDFYLVPLALFLKADIKTIGILVAIPNLLGSASQLMAGRLLSWIGHRRRFLIWGVGAQAFLLAGIALLPLMELPKLTIMTVLLSLICGFRILANLLGTVWGSLVSDYMSPNQRGSYFGWRSMITGLVGVVAVISAGFLLDSYKIVSEAAAFVLLFALTALIRFVSGVYMARMQDIPMETAEPSPMLSLPHLLHKLRTGTFIRFTLFVAAITFGTNLAAPFFSVFMLRDLHFSYTTYMVISLCSITAGLIACPIWGRHADEVGNMKVLQITSWFIPFIPLLWVFSTNPFWIGAVETLAGFLWGGFNLCAVNYIYDAVNPKNRLRMLSYVGLANGAAVFLGSAIGGLIGDYLPPIRGHSLYTLFLLSGLARLIPVMTLSFKLREIRDSVHHTPYSKVFFSVLGIRPMFGRTRSWNLILLFRKPAWMRVRDV